jgi:hypothetical protein
VLLSDNLEQFWRERWPSRLWWRLEATEERGDCGRVSAFGRRRASHRAVQLDPVIEQLAQR